MSRAEKLVDKLRRLPPEADFGDVRKVLETHGWKLDRIRGSHHHFTKPGANPPIITLPVHDGVVKRFYVKRVLEHLGLEE